MPNLKKKISLKTKSAMAEFADSIAKTIAKTKGAVVIGLVGDLGAGKTAFTQSFLKSLGVSKRITSPTFVLMKPYAIKAKHHHTAYHLDTYRIDSEQELLALDFKKIISTPGHVVLIEWADKFKKLLPKKTVWIEIEHGAKEGERLVIVK